MSRERVGREFNISPITPDEVPEAKNEQIPKVVIAVFNELIAQNGLHGSAVVYQKDVVQKLLESGLTSDEIYSQNMLDVEEVYGAAGWKVVYDKPGYNESYDANFTFLAIK